MPADSPSIAVVIPAYNVAGYIEAAIGSVLAQSSRPDEVIVVDDGSTDDTVAIARRAAASAPASLVTIIESPHAGAATARNTAIERVTSEWIAFLDADDRWLPEKIAKLRATIAARPDATIVAHDALVRDVRGRESLLATHAAHRDGRPLLPQIYASNFLVTSCVAVRTAALRTAGGFDPSFPSAHDYDLWLRLAPSATLVFIAEPLAVYEQRAGNISSDIFLRYQAGLRIAHRYAPGRLARVRRVLRIHRLAYGRALRARGRGLLRVAVRTPYELLRALVVH